MDQSEESSASRSGESQMVSSGASVLLSGETTLSKKWMLFNIVMLGVTFMFLFTAFQTCSMVQTLVLEGANNETNNTSGNGYTSLAIVYASFASANWIAPNVVALLGTKWSMISGGALYCIYIGLFLKPMEVTLYLSSVLVGIGAAVLWTAQGKFLSKNSSIENMTRNTGIFWALFQCSLIWGNLFVYFKFSDLSYIDAHSRTVLFIGLTSVGCLGLLLMLTFRTSKRDLDEPKESAKQVFLRSIKLLVTKEMLFLSVLFFYTGAETSFWSSVYITSVGHSGYFGTEAKQLAGFSGLATGVGQIIGGLLFGILGNIVPNRRPNKSLVVFIGFLLHVATYFTIFLTFDPAAPLVETSGTGHFAPNKYTVVASAVLLGLGDSAFNTQIYPILSLLFPADVSSACALFKFIQSLASAAAFVYSLRLLLQWQLLILLILSVIGSVLFFFVDRMSKMQIIRSYSEIN